MARPLLLIHGYSSNGNAFDTLKAMLQKKLNEQHEPVIDVNVGNYVSLNNEITIKDIGEGLQRAIEQHETLKDVEEFDAIVHSTGMLVVRSWLANHPMGPGKNPRLKRLKHLMGVAPATWGSPQAHKGRTWLGALVAGEKTLGPDFLNAGDLVLYGLELGSSFTWELAHRDLLGPEPYFGRGSDTPFVSVFIGNTPYTGLSSVANDPGTDGTVRWAGCGLNTRKITLDLTRRDEAPDGTALPPRVTMSDWATEKRLDVPMLAVEGKNHGTLVSDPDPGMVERILSFLDVADGDGYDAWLKEAQAWNAPALAKMKVSPGKDVSGITEEVLAAVRHLLDIGGAPLDGWQQFVVHARDEWGDPVTDYMIRVYRMVDGKPVEFEAMSTDVHAYAADPSFRCFYVQLPKGVCDGTMPMEIHIQASTGTEVMTYQGYGSDDAGQEMRADSNSPVVIEIPALGPNGPKLFYPFTTTLVEIILNRVPYPFGAISNIFGWLREQEARNS